MKTQRGYQHRSLFWTALKSLKPEHVAVLLMLSLWVYSHVEAAEQVAGQKVDCPPAMELVTISLGNRVIYQGCWATAELERAGYKTIARTDEGTVVCRTLHIKGK